MQAKLFSRFLKSGFLLFPIFSFIVCNAQVAYLNIAAPLFNNAQLVISEYNWILNKQSILFKSKPGDDGFIKIALQVNEGRKLIIGNSEVFIESEKEVFLTLDSNLLIQKVKSSYPGNYTIFKRLQLVQTGNTVAAQKLPELKKKENKQTLNKRRAIIEDEKNKGTISQACYNYLNADCTSRYLSSLYYYYKRNKDSISVPDSFLEEFTKKQFSDSKNLNSMFYSFALDDYVSYLAGVGRTLTSSAFYKKAEAINENFYGVQKEFLLTYLFCTYCRKQNAEYGDVIDQQFDQLIHTIKTPMYIEGVNYYYNYYRKANKSIPSNILNLQFSSITHNSIDLKTILDGGKPDKIILFWASWCSPCIREIMELKSRFPHLQSEKYDFIFISADEDSAKFNAMKGRLKIQSYLINKHSLSDLTDFFDLTALPRHILYQDAVIKDLNFDLQSIY